MGELLLCSREIASVPYYIDAVSLNVYSLEEICYYLKQNMELVEPEFMDEELCQWLRQELKMPLLADKLSKMIKNGESFAAFITTLMGGCDYCTIDEIKNVRKALEEFENKSKMECAKIRADRFLLKKRYHQCIIEYKKLLGLPELKEEGTVFLGNLYHNLGTAYAGLFFFEEAEAYFKMAYEKNRREESKNQAKLAKELLLLRDKQPNSSPAQSSLNMGIGNLAVVDNLLAQWKEEYIRSCK